MDDVFLADDGFMIVSEGSPTPAGRHSTGRSTTACAMEAGGLVAAKPRTGVLPERYALRETPGTAYLQRTEWNVRDSDATLVVTLNVAGKRESSTPGIAALVVEMLSQTILTNGEAKLF